MKISGAGNDFDPNDSASVIAACRRNDGKAQYALIRLYYGYVKNIALRFSANNQDSDEIINDSFLKAFTNLDKYEDKQAFKGWLRTIVVNTSIDYFRKSKQIPDHTDYQEIEKQFVPDVTEDAISRMSADEILGFIQTLSPAYRMVFSLYVIEGYTHKEIADKLGIREGTSKSNLQDARRKLQELIRKHDQNLGSAYELKPLRRDEDRRIG